MPASPRSASSGEYHTRQHETTETTKQQGSLSNEAPTARRYETMDARDLPPRVDAGRRKQLSKRHETSCMGAAQSTRKTEEHEGRGSARHRHDTSGSTVGSSKSQQAQDIRRRPVGGESQQRESAALRGYRDTAADGGLNDDESDVSSVDPFEVELLEFRKEEARKFVALGEWEKAKASLEELLDCLEHQSPSELVEWLAMLGDVLLSLELYDDAEALLIDGSITALKSSTCSWLLAEAHLRRGKLEEAKDRCAKAIRYARKNGESGQMQHAIFLMSEILEAMGKSTEARFYRSKVAKDYQPPRQYSRTAKTSLSAQSENTTARPEIPRAILDSCDSSILVDRTTGKVSGAPDKILNLYITIVNELTQDVNNYESAVAAQYLVKNTPNLAKISDPDNTISPLIYAATLGHRTLVELLLDNGADVNAADFRQYTALHHVLEQARFTKKYDDFSGLAQLLISRGADVNTCTYPQGGCQTPLHKAAWTDNLAAVQMLLRAGADPMAKDSYGRLPSEMLPDAPEFWEPEIMRILKQAEWDTQHAKG